MSLLSHLIMMMANSGSDPDTEPHQYWRMINPNTPGPGSGTVLEPAEIQVFDATGDVTSSATKTSTTPSFSTLSVQFDGDLTNRCQWANSGASDYHSATWFIQFDFGGSPKLLTGFKYAQFDTVNQNFDTVEWQYSDNGSAWTTLVVKTALGNLPGANFTLSPFIPFDDALVTTKWNSADKTASMSLISLDRRATEVSNTFHGVRANQSHSSGLRYIEFKIIALNSAGDVYLCLGTGAADMTSPGTGGWYTHWRDVGTILQDNGGHGTVTYTVGDVIGVVADIDNRDYWFAKNNVWVTGDPATLTSPTASAAGTGGVHYPGYLSDNTGTGINTVEIMGNAINQVYAAPAGTTPWGD